MDVKGLTLRSKGSRRRPKISAPQPIADHNSANKQPGAGKQGATSDLVKRRYSSKFNQIPGLDANAPAVPTLPTVAEDFLKTATPSDKDASSAGASQPIRVDIGSLKNPNLPVDKYIADLLANASEQDIRDYQRNLGKLKHRTSSDLQQSVYQNRTQFIKISKEAEKLKEEMSTLRGLMSELTTALGQTSAAAGTNGSSPALEEAPTSRRHAHRSSIANLESMWNVQLQTLWKTVERSQKFLPAIPGRHIVMESGQWVELDSATWKPRRPVHIVLLNDHLLVAAKKRKRVDPNVAGPKANAPTKLVAEECWPLQDIDMIDLGANASLDQADETAVPNAVNIRYGPNSFTYRHDQRNNRAKNDLVMTFRKTLEDLRKQLKTEAETTAQPREALLSSAQTTTSRRQSELLDNMDLRDKLEVLIDVDGKQQNMRWVEGQIDELDIDIAIQNFDAAVSLVERLRKLAKTLKNNLTAQEAINLALDERAGKLAEMLLRSLVDTPSFLGATKTNINWLTRLGFDDRAREAYLNARTQIITKRARHCIFEGDLPLYIFQISFVYFNMIKNTIAIYQQCFPSVMSSASIKWAKDHMDGFNTVLNRQLSSVEQDTPVWKKCMEIVYEHANMLYEVGVDFKDMIRVEGPTNGSSEASATPHA